MDDFQIPGADLHLARLTPEFAKWQAHLGYRVRQVEQFAPWAILRDKYGWGVLIRATERCECNAAGFKNVNLVGRLCQEMRRAEEQSRVEAETASRRLPVATAPKARLVKVDGTWVVEAMP